VSAKLVTPMVALSDASGTTEDQTIAARFFIASTSVTADNSRGRTGVLVRSDVGWCFTDLMGGGSVDAPLFGSDFGSAVRVVLAEHELALSDEGFVLETGRAGWCW
jgi:hypothetical protein